jgi:hypothetical protein
MQNMTNKGMNRLIYFLSYININYSRIHLFFVCNVRLVAYNLINEESARGKRGGGIFVNKLPHYHEDVIMHLYGAVNFDTIQG